MQTKSKESVGSDHLTIHKNNSLKESNIEVCIQWLHGERLCSYGQSNGKDRAGQLETSGKPKWTEVMEEMDALQQNQTLDLVMLPNGIKALAYKQVFKITHDVDGAVSWYKAQLAANDYAQTQDIDYEETFTLIAKMAMIRSILSLV